MSKSRSFDAPSPLNVLRHQLRTMLPAGVLDDRPRSRPRVDRRRVVEAVAGAARTTNLVSLCANPGYGASTVALAVAESLAVPHRPLRLDLSDLEPSSQLDVLRSVTTSLRECSREGCEPVVVYDTLHGFDEGDARDATELLDAQCRSALVVLVCDPSANLLLDALGEHPRFGAKDLLVRTDELRTWLPWAATDEECDALARITGLIPSLVGAVGSDRSLGVDPSSTDRYDLGRQKLVADAVARALIEEDARFRGACALLGEGGVLDLKELGVRADNELFEAARTECPVLGIAPVGTRFSMVGGPFCPEGAVDLIAARFPDLVFDAIQVLVNRGRFESAVRIAARCVDTVDMVPVIDMLPVELFDAGGAELLRTSLLELDPSEGRSTGLKAAHGALSLCSGNDPGTVLAAFGKERPEPLSMLADAVGLYRESRVFWSAGLGVRPRGTGVLAEARAATMGRLAAHLNARTKLLEGRFGEAARALAAFPVESDVSTLSGSLLEVDRYLLSAVEGWPLGLGEKRAVGSALVFLKNRAPAPWGAYEEAFCWFGDVLRGRRLETPLGDAALSSARRRGDQLMEGVALAASALAELQLGRFAGAAAKASEARRRPIGPWLEHCCSVVALVAGARRGDQDLAAVGLACEEGVDDALAALCSVLTWSLSADPVAAGRGGRLADHAPDPVSVLVAESVMGMGEPVATRLWNALPEPWQLAVKERRSGLGRDVPTGVRIEVSVLGSVRISVDGEEVDGKAWRRAASRYLIAYLALKEGHAASRHEAFRELWPDRSPDRAVESYYVATSCVRKALGIKREDPQPLDLRHGMLSLSASLVSCDIDRLRESLAAVFSSPDPNDGVDAALAASRLYGTGVFVPSSGPWRDFFREERRALEIRYIEGLVHGAELARSAGRAADGLVLARAAHGLDVGHEEACACLMRLLVDCRRFGEAEAVYRRHARYIFKNYGLTPGGQIKKIVEEIEDIKGK